MKEWRAVAEVMVRRALDSAPELTVLLAAAGVAVVDEVSGAGWVSPVEWVWGGEVWPNNDADQDGDSIVAPFWRVPTARPTSWVAYRRDGTKTDHTPDRGNAEVLAALSAGVSVVGFSPAPERYLPSDLVRAADVRIASRRWMGWRWLRRLAC